MEPFIRQSEQHFHIEDWQDIFPKLVVGFTTKIGGESKPPFSSFNLGLHVKDNKEDVKKNRESLANTLDFPTRNWICSEQIHDCHIEKVTRVHAGNGVFDYEDSIPGTDGVYTGDKNLLLTSAYADCVPLFFFHPKKQLIGLAHAGWKGSVKNIAGKIVSLWEEKEGILAKDMLVAIGPSIGNCCYIVDDNVINQVKPLIRDPKDHPFQDVSEGQYRLDLKTLNKYLLMKAGIPEENIYTSSYCTSCEESLFFSHRRDQGKTGRMLSFIGMKG